MTSAKDEGPRAKEPVRDFRTLIAWKKAHDLALRVYRSTTSFPPSERFGLTSQMRRAAVSTVTNVVEGWGRGTPAEYRHFVRISRGSANELHAELLLAGGLGFVGQTELREIEDQLLEVKRLLRGLLKSLGGRRSESPPSAS